jgi:TatD DNase family protein
MLVDSHCHLDHLNLDISEVLDRAHKNDVSHVLSVGLDPVQSQTVIKIAENYPNVSASIGIHPTEKIEKELSADDLIKLADHLKVIAIGETGLDFYRAEDKENQLLQIERFRAHIRAAKMTKKPLIIHSRMARAETLQILREEKAEEIGGVLHCFTESLEMAKQAMDLNFYISFSGIITFKNAVELQEVAQKIPLERILIETDAPYLAPVPFRGKPNEPSYVKYVAEKLSELRNEKVEKIAEMTTRNFFDLFSLADRSVTHATLSPQ